jgi:hypothetical protein
MVIATLLLVAFGAPVPAGQPPPAPRDMLADATTSASPPPNGAPAEDAAERTAPARPPSPAQARRLRIRPMVPDDDLDQRPVRNPVWGFMLEFGLGGGGDDLVKVSLSDGSTQTLSAGDGVALSLGLMWTPLWLGDALGVGVSGTFGYKGWSVGASNGDISIGRFPFTAAVHVMPRIARNWLLLARGGIDKETAASVSSSGDAAGIGANLDAKLGGFGEGGFYYTYDVFKSVEPKEDGTLPAQHGAWSLTFRYTKLTYTANGVSVDGQSLMFFSTLYYNP